MIPVDKPNVWMWVTGTELPVQLIPDAKENREMKTLQQLKCSLFIKTS